MADDQTHDAGSFDSVADFSKLMEGVFPEQMTTNWIIIAETLTENGPDIHVQSSEFMSPWLAAGMLQFATEVILNSGFAQYEDEDE